ncbi:MAG TPA: hypothetical protein VNC16_00600 [Solirubrobacterales bacterium]|jgi:hypothetical protein|nr:hypothetical protein [Solirubrobacterales bacterium]
MTNRSILLATWALAAFIASAALPAISAAGEFKAHCSKGPTCTSNVAGGPATFEDDGVGSMKIECAKTGGGARHTSGTSKGVIIFVFEGCEAEALGFSCNTPGKPLGTIVTNELPYDLVFIDSTPTVLVGMLITSFNETITCPVLSIKRTITGNVIGKIEDPECNVPRASHTIEFKKGAAAGSMQFTQVTTVGQVFDMTWGVHEADGTTLGIRGTYSFTYNEGQTLTYTC